MKNFKQFLAEELSAMSSTPETIETNKQPPVSNLTVLNKQQLRQNPSIKDTPDFFEERKTPEEKWDDVFNKDNFYGIWKTYWADLYGENYTNQEEMNSEFERIIDLMRWKFLKLVTARAGSGGSDNPGMDAYDALDEAILLFISYFQQPAKA
jgi:hypothetical protein